MVLAKPEQGWRGWGHPISEPDHAEHDPSSTSRYRLGALGKLEMPRLGERVTGDVTSSSWRGARGGWGRWPGLRHGQEGLELLTSRSPHFAGARGRRCAVATATDVSLHSPGESYSHGTWFFGLVPLLAHPYPCTHSYVFLRVLNGLSGQWLGYFRASRAILGSGCETPWAGGKGQALVCTPRAAVGLGLGTAGMGRGGGKPWDGRRKPPRELPRSCRGQAGWEDTRGHADGGELEGRAGEGPGTPGTPPGQGLQDRLQQSGGAGCSPLDAAAVLPTREKVPAGQPGVLGTFYRPFPSRSLRIKGG